MMQVRGCVSTVKYQSKIIYSPESIVVSLMLFKGFTFFKAYASKSIYSPDEICFFL